MNSFDEPEADDRWQVLRAEIEQVVQLVETPIELGNQPLQWLRVANPDVLLEIAVNDEHRPAATIDPFWAATWRAALGLDRFLGDQPIQGVRLLELGCGSGQAGCGAGLRGAQVTLTDSVDIALKVAELNCRSIADRVSFQRLLWAEEQLNAKPFPIIIGSDLVYDPNLFPQLESCMRQHLAEGGRVLLSEPHRHSGDKFAKWIVDAHWHTVEHDIDLGDGRVPIRVFECNPLPVAT